MIVRIALGLAALAGRTVSPDAVALTAAAGVMSAGVPAGAVPAATRRWLWVTAIGTAAFASSRLFGPVLGAGASLASVVAAVAEEAFFRRLVYGALERWGTAAAIAGSAVAFAAVHVPVYGWEVVPVDLAAGLMFGWQRWAAGTWTSSAVAHTAANLLG